MFYIFHLLLILLTVVGLTIGAFLGFGYGNLSGAILGGTYGLGIGLVVGLLPWFLSWSYTFLDLRLASSEQLRNRVEKEYKISHLLIAELATRDEPIEYLRETIERQLRSHIDDERRHAARTASKWFPDLVETE